MKVSQAIVKRRSIRGYKKDRVPDDIACGFSIYAQIYGAC